MLAEHLPLEQGLRHPYFYKHYIFVALLAEHLPLEQGLRLRGSNLLNQEEPTRRASSIRTRIKTNSEEC